MAYNKITLNGETKIDLTQDTVTAKDVALGKTFHLSSGEIATGVLEIQAEDGSEMRVVLPDAFVTGTSLYTHNVTTDKILVSGNITNIGVWVYTKSIEEWTQVKNNGYYYQYFQNLPNGKILISGSPDLLLYSPDDDSCQVISSGLNFSEIEMLVSGDCLLYCSTDKFIYKYSIADNTVNLRLGQTNWNRLLALPDGNCLISSSITSGDTNIGVYLYDASENKCTKVYNTGKGWSLNQVLPDGNVLLTGSFNSTGSTGVLLYKTSTETVDSTSNTDRYASPVHILPNGDCLISSSSSGGVWLYDASSQIVQSKVSNVGSMSIFHDLSNGDCLFCSTSSSFAGIYKYNASDKTVTRLFTNNQKYSTAQELPNGDCLLTNGSVVVIYKASNNTISYVTQDSKSWNFFELTDDGNCLVGGKSTARYLYVTDTGVFHIYSMVI
jgi:hypothetical protein